jgi:hypothetical protein
LFAENNTKAALLKRDDIRATVPAGRTWNLLGCALIRSNAIMQRLASASVPR